MKKKFTRREFLQVSAATAVGVSLAACGVTSEPTKVPAPTLVPGATIVPTQAALPTAIPKPSPIEITLTRYEHPAQPILQDALAHKALTNATGVKINFSVVPQADYASKQKLWLASKQIPDLMQCTNVQIRDYSKPEILQPLTPLIEKYAPNLKRYLADNPEMKKLKTEGEVYYIPGMGFNYKRIAPMPLIRTDLLQKAGLAVPETFDQLFEVLKELKKANPNSLGWTCRNGTLWHLTLASYPMGSGYGASQLYAGTYYDWDLRKWLFGPIHEEFKDCLSYFARAYKEDIFDHDFAITTSDQWHEKNSSNRGVFSWENLSFCLRWNQALRGADPKATWAPLPTLAYKKVKRQLAYGGYYEGWSIGANAKNPDRIIQLLDWMITPLGIDTCSWGVEGTHFTRKSPLPQSIQQYTEDSLNSVLKPQRNEIVPELFEKYKKKTDPMRSYLSDAGAGYLDLFQIYDSAPTYLWDPPGEADTWYDVVAKDKALKPRGLQPPFTAAESERIKKVQTDVDAIVNPAFDKVILGQFSLSDYDKAVEQAKKVGAEDLEKIYNEAEARAAM